MTVLNWVLVLPFLMPALVHAEDGLVVALKGSVSSTVQGKSSVVKIGSHISDGASVSTKANAFTVISLPDGTHLKLKEDTTVLLHLPEAKHVGPTTVDLVAGALFAAVTKHTEQHFQVKTRAAVAGVRGTEFFTSIGEKDAFWLCVNEGAVDVTPTGSKSTVSVPKGLGILVEKGKEPDPPKPYAWTKKLNWNMDGDVEDHTQIQMEYKNLLHYHYD